MILLPEHIAIILEKQLKSQLNEDELQVLNHWRREKEEHEVLYQQLTKLWQEAGTVLETPVYNTEKAWNKLDLKLRKKKSNTGRYLMAACFIGILFLAGWLLLSPKETSITAKNNTTITLPDGSTVILRDGAKITYPKAFKERNIALSGEAYFDVKQDRNHPFRIKTDRATLEVLGTSFVINSTKAYDKLVVSTGKVLFAKHIIIANEAATLDNKGLDIKPVADANYLSWQTGILKFDNSPISQVAVELSHYYNLYIKADNAINSTITAKFDHQPVEEVLDEIKLLTGISYRKQQDTILLIKP